jgi:hypothetical protein
MALFSSLVPRPASSTVVSSHLSIANLRLPLHETDVPSKSASLLEIDFGVLSYRATPVVLETHAAFLITSSTHGSVVARTSRTLFVRRRYTHAMSAVPSTPPIPTAI